MPSWEGESEAERYTPLALFSPTTVTGDGPASPAPPPASTAAGGKGADMPSPVRNCSSSSASSGSRAASIREWVTRIIP